MSIDHENYFREVEQTMIDSGVLPDRIQFGAWRPIQDGDKPDPRFVSKKGETFLIPCRLYGPPCINTGSEINMQPEQDSIIENF